LLLLLLQIENRVLSHVFAVSGPSFERQEIGDVEKSGWIFWPSINKEENIASKDGSIISIPTADNEVECTFEMSISPEITSVSYMSDGKRFNSTIWMSSKLLQNIVLRNNIDSENSNSTSSMPLWHTLKFTVAIDIFSNFNQAIDYRIELSGKRINSSHSEWKKEMYEISSDGTNKIISTEFYEGFPFQEQEFVDFSVGLKYISNPQKYRVLFYITDLYVKDGKLCRMVDSTNWVLSPPPEFNIIVSPNSIFMRPGDKRDIIVTISGNTDIQSTGRLDINYTNNKNNVNNINNYNNGEFANLSLLSNETIISSFSNGTSILRITIPSLEIDQSKHLIIPIVANISFPTALINRDGQTFYNNKSISLLEHSNVLLTILPSLTLTERIDEFAKTIRPIGELWQIFAAIGTVVISATLYIHKKRKNNQEKGQ
jgi:hypothetical protein